MKTAKGTFDVKMTPLSSPDEGTGAKMGRMSIDKTYHGDIVGKGTGEMLSAMGNVSGSAGYVAMERISGTVHGKSGSFVIQHFGLMDRGTQSQQIVIVPGTGTDDFAGISGTYYIEIKDAVHYYTLVYTLVS